MEDAFIDSLSEYYLLDENQIDKLWRFGLLEYILIDSMAAFQANRITSVIDDLVPEHVNMIDGIENNSDHVNSNNQIVDLKKTPTQIYVSPKFERESWDWQIEDRGIDKSKKD